MVDFILFLLFFPLIYLFKAIAPFICFIHDFIFGAVCRFWVLFLSVAITGVIIGLMFLIMR